MIGANKGGYMALRVSGSVVLMCDEARRVFFLQRKDQKHPRPDCRGKLALWGGMRLPNGDGELEQPFETLQRRLQREFVDPLLSEAVLAAVSPRAPAFYDLIHPAGHRYRLAVFVAAVPAQEMKGWWRRLKKEGSVRHGVPVYIHRQILQRLAFVGQQDIVVRSFCDQHDQRGGFVPSKEMGRKLITELGKITKDRQSL